MKRIKLVIVLILSLFFTMTNVSALVNTNIIGSIEGKYSFGNYNITDTNVYLYRIAELSSDEKFTYMQDFVLLPTDINTLGVSEWNDYATEVYKYIKDNNINYIKEVKTDGEGKFTFSELNVGLYLILVDSKETEDYEYSSKPILISIPNRNEITDTYMYDLSIFIKTEAKSLSVNPGGDNDNPDPPYTGDDIYKYVLIFAGSFVFFVGIVVYLIIKAKKK